MKTKRNWLVATFLTILLMSLAAPLIALPVSANEDNNDDVRIFPGTWYRLESDIVTVLFPAGGKKPMFIWWYTSKPDQIYVVKFKGLIEWFAFDHPMLPENPEYYKRAREAWNETWRERFEHMYFEPEENRWMGRGEMGMAKLWLMHQIMEDLNERFDNWHRPFLPFDAGRWTLSDIANITTPEGNIIGVSFAFKLRQVWLPGFEFAEDNIMIRVRFYNETVEETVPGTDFKYTVKAGEMKMDFVVNEWKWNFDTIKELIQQLQRLGFNIDLPEGKSRLALWVNLASINITKLPLDEAEEQPKEIEGHSPLTHVDVEDLHEDVTINRTETEEERPIETSRPIIKLSFANETQKLGGFFRFVSSAKITDYPSEGDVTMVPVKASYISGGAHMRLFIGYPYFGNGSLEHDPSIGVDIPGVETTSTPKYSVQAPSGNDITPVVLGKYQLPLFTTGLMVALIAVISATAIILYIAKWKRKTPANMVGSETRG